MADYTDTKVSQLVINNLTQEKFEELKAAGQLQDDQIYCTPDSGNGFDLFDSKWADHILNDPSWLRADNFSWQSGDVYVSAWEHLLDDFENRIGKGTDTDGWLTETIGNTTVYYVVAPDGHKICAADQEANVQAVFDSKEVAWYYIIDLDNKQFKLPRTRWGFTGLRDTVGGYVPAGLPNITGQFYVPATYGSVSSSGAFNAYNGGSTGSPNTAAKAGDLTVKFEASRSSSVYGASNTVQPRATQMYLYFYVGDWIKDKELVDVGTIAEGLNNKADVSALDTKANTSFNNVNNDAKGVMAGMSMISNTHVDLTLGASGAAYTAPADGYVYLAKASSDGQHVQLNQGKIAAICFSPKSGATVRVWLPVKAGSFTASYDAGGSAESTTFRFVYAEGTKHLA